MSLKAAELQVALPRTQEISRMQDQLHQRNVHEQQSMIADRNHLDEAMRHRANEVDESSKGYIKEKEERQRKKEQDTLSLSGIETTVDEDFAHNQIPMRDPIRGRHVDISL